MNRCKIRIEYIDDPKLIYEAMGNKYQVFYDRLFDRRFGKVSEGFFEGIEIS